MKFWNDDPLYIISNLNFIYNKCQIYFLFIIESKIYIFRIGLFYWELFLVKTRNNKKR